MRLKPGSGSNRLHVGVMSYTKKSNFHYSTEKNTFSKNRENTNSTFTVCIFCIGTESVFYFFILYYLIMTMII